MMKNIFTYLLIFVSYYATAQTVQVTTITDEIPASGGVKLDAVGNLYIANFGDGLSNANGNQIWKLDTEGNLSVFATGFQGASGNDFDSQGNLFQSNIAGSFISKVSPEGQVSTFTSAGISGPVGIAIDSQDNLYVCNCSNNTIRKVTAEGVSTQFAAGTIFSCPNGITLDHEENIYVSNFGNANVVKITPEGQTSVFASIPGNNNGHLTYCAADSVLYVLSHGSHKVYRLSLDQELSTVAGSGIRGNMDGTANVAQFSRPNGVAVTPSGDTLYLNSSIPLSNNGLPLNPSVVRMITGLNPSPISAIRPTWAYEGLELSHFPNPVQDEAIIQFDLPKTLDIAIQLYHLDGRPIKTIIQRTFQAGTHQLTFKPEGLNSGLYFYTISNADVQLARTMLIK